MNQDADDSGAGKGSTSWTQWIYDKLHQSPHIHELRRPHMQRKREDELRLQKNQPDEEFQRAGPDSVMETPDDLAALVGGHLDTVSFVMDYVEFRINYSVLRCVTRPIVRVDAGEYRFPDLGSRDALCQLIDAIVAAAELHEDRVELRTSSGHTLVLPLDEESRRLPDGFVDPEAVHLVPADDHGRLIISRMLIW